ALAHYRGQEELAQAIHNGLAARERGDIAAATELLGRAVRIADESGHAGMTTLLTRVVEGQPGGTVVLKGSANRAATMDLALESTPTLRASRPQEPPGPAAPEGGVEV